jgi:hypothetical protein
LELLCANCNILHEHERKLARKVGASPKQ